MIADTSVAPITMDRVTARRPETPEATSWPVNHERPRSPWSAEVSQSQNWARRGWSSPSSAAFWSTVACEAFWPRMRRAMSPPPR